MKLNIGSLQKIKWYPTPDADVNKNKSGKKKVRVRVGWPLFNDHLDHHCRSPRPRELLLQAYTYILALEFYRFKPNHIVHGADTKAIRMSDEVITKREILMLVGRVAVLSAFSYYTLSWLMDSLDPSRKQQLRAQEKAKKLLKSLGIDPKKDVKLTNYEMMIASSLVEPEAMNVGWKDIAGLESVVQELRDTVILPIQKRELFADSKLTQAPKGVLLHGPPGCGKTMIAKATAREAGARFINLDVSVLTDKWYGESQKLASAVFTLARKIAPCIVFVDEIDSLLRSRDSHDHEATAMIKAQFMQMWDGLETTDEIVVVMGATNRPRDVDRAILRRMPATFHIGLPTEIQRKAIFQRVLAMEAVAADIDYVRLSQLTEGFSGSDIRETCRAASVYRMRELASATTSVSVVANTTNEASSAATNSLRKINNSDLLNSVSKLRESKVHCGFIAPKMSGVGGLD